MMLPGKRPRALSPSQLATQPCGLGYSIPPRSKKTSGSIYKPPRAPQRRRDVERVPADERLERREPRLQELNLLVSISFFSFRSIVFAVLPHPPLTSIYLPLSLVCSTAQKSLLTFAS